MNYTDYVNQLSTMMAEQDSNDPAFQTILPSIIAYAEGRMYRDLDMLGTTFTDTTQTLLASTRDIALPPRTIIVQDINLIDPTTQIRYPQLVPVSREFLDWSFPTVAGAGVPQYFAMTAQLTGIVGPWPLIDYTLEVVGTENPAPLSSTNQDTLLTKYVPETFLACSMIEASGYQKNYGAQADNPQSAVSWEMQYAGLMKSAAMWEFRKRFSMPPMQAPAMQ